MPNELKHCLPVRLALAVSFWLVWLPLAQAAEYDIYLLAGQSNMEGKGFNQELPDELKKPRSDVMIFHGQAAPDNKTGRSGEGLWAPLQPGHGIGFRTDGQQNHYSDRFGPELSFATQISKLRPNRKVALIKYAKGGTSIAVASRDGCWDTNYDGGEGKTKGLNQYDHCLATIRTALAVRDIDDDGEDDQLTPVGILWMQGEADAYDQQTAEAYCENITNLMSHLCAALRRDDLPIVIGLTSDSHQGKNGGPVRPFSDLVREAQRRFAREHANVAIVEATDTYGYQDRGHYDSAGYLDMGRQFATEIAKLLAERE